VVSNYWIRTLFSAPPKIQPTSTALIRHCFIRKGPLITRKPQRTISSPDPSLQWLFSSDLSADNRVLRLDIISSLQSDISTIRHTRYLHILCNSLSVSLGLCQQHNFNTRVLVRLLKVYFQQTLYFLAGDILQWIVPLFARPIPSICLYIQSTAKTVKSRE